MENWQQFVDRKNGEWLKERDNSNSKPHAMKDVGRKGKHLYRREAWTFMPQSNLPKKIFAVERLRKVAMEGKMALEGDTQVGELEYRIGYWIVGQIGNKKNKWTWGQFCPLIPQEDLMRLIAKAQKEGTIIDKK